MGRPFEWAARSNVLRPSFIIALPGDTVTVHQETQAMRHLTSRRHAGIRLAGFLLAALSCPCAGRAAKPGGSRPTSGSALRLVAAPHIDRPSATPLFDSDEERPGALLETIEQRNRLVTDAAGNRSRSCAARGPGTNVREPRGSRTDIEAGIVADPGCRSFSRKRGPSCARRLESALRESARVANTKDILDRQREEAQAAAVDRLRIANGLVRKETKIKQLMDRFNSLMDEGRYVAADELGEVEVAGLAPELPIAQSSSLTAHITGAGRPIWPCGWPGKRP